MTLVSIEEEIVKTLLDNDKMRKGLVDIIEENNEIYVMVNRSRGIRRYLRVNKEAIRVMTDEERDYARKLLHHPLATEQIYKGKMLEELKRDGSRILGRLLAGIQSNGYNVIGVTIYYLPSPFDIKVPVLVTKVHNEKTVSDHVYVIDRKPVYIKTE